MTPAFSDSRLVGLDPGEYESLIAYQCADKLPGKRLILTGDRSAQSKPYELGMDSPEILKRDFTDRLRGV
ncbi:MAG: hypothetical protein EB829_03525 [Nitrosopumilus sp. H8]|nr:MAG: hypothetical protein EB829_03525 [Nitrosopumilus sp. H8]